MVSPHHSDWYKNYALLESFIGEAKEEDKKKLELAVIQSNSKVSSLYEYSAQFFGMQSTPFLPQACRYHRSTPNALLDNVQEAVAEELSLTKESFALVEGPLIRENIAREFPNTTNYSTDAALIEQIDAMLVETAESGAGSGWTILDISKYIQDNKMDAASFSKAVEHFETLLREQIEIHAKDFPDSPIQDFADFNELVGITFFALFENDNYTLLLTNDPTAFLNTVKDIMKRSGFQLTPDQAKATWLKICPLGSILSKAGVQEVNRDESAPEIRYRTIEALLKSPEAGRFEKLSQIDDPPYLKIHVNAIHNLLRGFSELSIDNAFKEHKLERLLQISYTKIAEAMNQAVEHNENLVIFRNQIELIHQEMQMWLIILEPYQNTHELETAVLSNLSEILPKGCGVEAVYLKASAMRGFSSLLAATEHELNKENLSVCVHRDSYYHETDETLKSHANRYDLAVFDSDKFVQAPIEDCFIEEVEHPFDLVVLEYNHNVSASRRHYHKEDLLAQIKAFDERGLLNEKCVICIDTTINLERSPDLKKLFEDTKIQELISSGKLSIVLLRSAQKFDMLGIDNFYGGIVVTVNNPESFRRFNERMNHPRDQLKGLNYDGLTHLEKYASEEIEQFRKAVMENTWQLFNMLPKEMVASHENHNPIQVSRIDDKGQILLDLKFATPEIKNDFFKYLDRYTRAHKLACMMRPSFSFMYTTYIMIGNAKSRITPGLEGKRDLALYGEFFRSIQDMINNNENFSTQLQAATTRLANLIISEKK